MTQNRKQKLNMKYIVPVIAIAAMLPLGAAANIANLWSFADVPAPTVDENGVLVANNETYAPADLDQRLSNGSVPQPAVEAVESVPTYAPAAGPQYAPQQQFAPQQQYPQQYYGNAPFGGYPSNGYGGYPGGNGYNQFGYGSSMPNGNGYGGYPYNNGGYGGSYGNVPSGSSPFFGGTNSPFGFW